MAEKLSIQIALDGGAEIERQLAGIGDAGQKAFSDIAASAEKVGFRNIKPEEVTAKLQEMGVTGVEAIDKIQAAVQKAGRLEGLVRGITSIETALAVVAKAAPIAGVAIVGAMVSAAKATIAFAESVNKVNDQAIKLGVGVEQVDKFRAGLERAGVSAESVGQILQSKLATEQGVVGLESFIRQLERMPDSAARSKAAVQEFGQAGAELIRILQAGSQITGFAVTGLISAEDAKKATQLGQALNQLESSFNRLSTVSFAPAITTGINAVTGAVQVLGQRLEQTPWTTFVNAANLGLNPVASLISTINGAITFLGGSVQKVGIETEKASTLFTSFGTVATQAATQPTTTFTTLGTTVTQTGQQAAQAGQTAASGWDVFLRKLDEIARKAGTILGGGGGGAPAPAMAGGGLLGGSGTGTSDSNLAWVSRGEHIMPARAVQQPGVLGFLEALRRSGGNLSRVLDGMGRFALGGLVRAPIPAFASGGLAGGGNHVTIQFPGLPAIGGLRASSSVVEQLQKAAALAQVRSGGRKPSRYS